MNTVLILFTLVAWLVHSAVAGAYTKQFSSTTSIIFRLTHAIEIAITTSIMSLLFVTLTDYSVSVVSAVLTVLLTLIVLDGISLIFAKKLREQFDIGHFVLAYLAAGLAVAIVFSLA